MAESACLRRSFSNPSETSHEFSEGDPIRALGESISFGRYMSETLAWEKWSAFSHNRYREEAEKYSKPGSVAKMKAYFEAHYKKAGVKKPAALQQANDDSSYDEPEVEDIHNADLVSSSSSTLSSPTLNPKTAFPNSHSTSNDIRRSLSSPALHPGIAIPDSNSINDEFTSRDVPNVEPLPSVIVSCGDSSAQAKESENEAAAVVESSSNFDCKECPEIQEYHGDNAVVNGSITEISAEIKVVQSRDEMESSKIQITPEWQATIEEAKDMLEPKSKQDPRSKQKSADASLRSSKKSNVSKLSSSLARLATPIRSKKEGDATLENPKLTRASVEKKKPMPKLVQMSVDVNSDVKLMKKSSSASHKSGIGKVFTPLGKVVRQSFAQTPAPSTSKVVRQSFAQTPAPSTNKVVRQSFAQTPAPSASKVVRKSFAQTPAPSTSKVERQSFAQTPAPSTSRASVNSVSRHPFVTPQLETKRNMKSPAQSPITFSPFSFRTEERAIKRREFFERRVEKEAEKLQLIEKAKVKSKADFRKSSQCVNFSNAAVNSRREVLSDKTKIPTALLQPPKYRSKPSTNLARGKCSQPLRSSFSSKPVSGNNKSTPVTLPTKKRHENDSPNIF